MEDLRHADLSARPDEELTQAERLELKRRLEAFAAAVKEGSLRRPDRPAAGPKRIRKWQPPVLDGHRGGSEG